MRRLLGVLIAIAGAAIVSASAHGSEVVGFNAADVTLAVSADGTALITYRRGEGGSLRRLLASGAINARHPSQTVPQVSFRYVFSPTAEQVRAFQNTCQPYDGPTLHWLLVACKAPDGSYWALQQWQRLLPNYGVRPTARQAARELRLSHWSGEIAKLEVKLDWAYRRFHHLYGRLTYLGRGVHGFRTTSRGVPLDTYGRNVYVDTLNSRYGRGWKRENSFLANRPRGNFCYGFFPHGRRPTGRGRTYRATVIGPGVTPDVFWESKAPGPYNRALDLQANREQRRIGCRPN